MKDRNSHDKYKTYSYSKLSVIEKSLPRQLSQLEHLIDKTQDKINIYKNKVYEIEQKIQKNIENKIGTNQSNNNGLHIISYFICFIPITLYLYLKTDADISSSLFVAFFISFFPYGFVYFLFEKLISSSSALQKLDYDKTYEKIYKAKTKNNSRFKNTNKKLKNLERKIEILDNNFWKLKNLNRNIGSFKNRAKRREERSKIVAFDKKARDGAQIVRRDLLNSITSKQNWKCPYCNLNKKISFSQADHIHPINKGGLSTYQNMVLICRECNSNKKALTLRVFAKNMNYNFNKICDRLELLGKDV